MAILGNAGDFLNYGPIGGAIPDQPSQQYYEPVNWEEIQRRQIAMTQQMQQWGGIPSSFNSNEQSGEKTLTLIKKSVKQIKAEAVSKEAQDFVNSKIERLQKLGVTAQAEILKQELQVRIKLARIQEWDYKVLPYEAIKEYDGKIVNSYTLKVHIDLLDKYCGQDEATEAKDRIIPDVVLTELETAKDRQVFDEFSVLWIEKVKDPLLLGSIKGCKDLFLIAEWGEDVKFDDMVKPKQ